MDRTGTILKLYKMKSDNILNRFKYAFSVFALGILLVGCSNDDETFTDDDGGGVEKPGPVEADFAGPTYRDDYTSIASWSLRSQWNLANVHDPSVVKDGDYFYMYQTDASYGNAHEGHGHYPVRRSKDLINWEHRGAVFQQAPAWIKDSLNNMRARMDPPLAPINNPNYGFWAPHISKVGDTYRLYYSVIVTNPIVGSDPNTSWTERAFIGLAETTDLASNNWVDKGMVIHSVADGRETYTRSGVNDWSGYFKFNAIDPSFIVTPDGEHWLIYGSWHSGIVAVQVDPTTGKPHKLNTLEDYGVRIAGRGNVNNNRWQALEAPEIIYNEETGYYYLFLAYDELSVAYNTRVARSQNITGPYFGIDGGNVTEGAEAWPMITHPYAFDNHTGWVGFSHNSTFRDPDTGEWFYASQARLPENVPGINVSNAVMMGHIRKISWTEDGWPVVSPERYAGVPEKEITEADIIGVWEHINFEYEYKTMQESVFLVFNSNHTLGGNFSGTWSLDSQNKKLLINGREHILNNSWDWEASPRKTTITYTGLTSSGRPVWGKKTN